MALDSGLYDACGNVSCGPITMITRYNNDIYTGSYMDEIAGVYANGIALWNSQFWSPVGAGLYYNESSSAYAAGFCEYNGQLFVVGAFRWAGSDSCNSVAVWDGVDWKGLNFPANLDGSIPLTYRVLFYKNEMYVGGNFFHEIDGYLNDDIARFDGMVWKRVGDGLKGGLSNVYDMAIYHDELYVCGYFRAIDGNTGNKIIRWNGEQWKDVGGGLCSPFDIVTDMMVYEDKLFVVGIFNCVGDGLPAENIATWDGKRWCSFGNSHFNNKIGSIAEYNSDIYIGGGFTEIDGQPVKYFAKWIGDHATDTCSAPVVAAPEPQQAAVPALSVSPNPAHSTVMLALEGGAGSGKPARFSIFNSLGQEIWSGMSASGREEVSLAGRPPGAYVARAESEGGVATRVFVKE